MHFLHPQKNSKNILYLSYDGMLEPLGESQVLGYLTKMCQDRDFEFTLISFEKRQDLLDHDHLKRIRDLCAANGIHWIPLPYHKNPVLLATAWDILVCTFRAFFILMKKDIEIIHARSYVASVPALFLKLLCRKKFIFDMRGFWADERADAGQWPRSGRIYKSVKWFEKQFLTRADAVVSLTHSGVDEMKRFDYLKSAQPTFAVIPTCVDLEKFRPKAIRSESDGLPFLLGHIGSIGSWYLFDEAVLFFKALKEIEPKAKLLIVNRNEHERILQILTRLQVSEDSYILRSANHDEMPEIISQLSASVFFIKSFYSKKASAPTKFAELMSCGIPCVVNAGVGDMDLFFNDQTIGVSVSSYDAVTFRHAALMLLKIIRDPKTLEICRSTALRSFSVSQGARDYLNLYRQILLRR